MHSHNLPKPKAKHNRKKSVHSCECGQLFRCKKLLGGRFHWEPFFPVNLIGHRSDYLDTVNSELNGSPTITEGTPGLVDTLEYTNQIERQ